MTKVIDSASKKEKSDKTPIKFIKFLDRDLDFIDSSTNPSKFDFVERVNNLYGNIDLFKCWNNGANESNKYFYLGHWNDGVAE